MKKILRKILIISLLSLSLGANQHTVNAADAWVTWTQSFTVTTEMIPWWNCEPYWTWTWITERKYKCTVDWNFWSVMNIFRSMIKYVVLIATLVWILMLVLSWIQLSISWNAKKAKDKFVQVIVALVVLFLVWFILNTVAPWVYK